ncbi:hypothetical protein As57867_006892, partial [Aphanomyces stellatus]
EAAKADGTLSLVQHAFSGTSYWIHPRDFYTKLPFIMLFSLVMLSLPMENNTRRYVLNNNLYFSLTLASPNDFTNPGVLKTPGDDNYNVPNILRNLCVYSLLGVFGAMIAHVMIWIPYPIFAMRQLQTQTQTCADSIHELLNLIVDTYCFKNKDVESMNLLRLKLQRKFDAAVAKHAAMLALLNNVWWEQLVGLHIPLKFHMSTTKPYVELFGSQIGNLRALNQAIVLEKYQGLHETLVKSLQKEIHAVQMHASKLLDEIATNARHGVVEMDLKSAGKLERHMEQLLSSFQRTQTQIYKRDNPTPAQVEGNIPFNLFLFSMQSYCTTLLEFQPTLRSRTRHTGVRMWKFVKAKLYSYVDKANYPPTKIQVVVKSWLAILVACFVSVYTFAYSNTTANAVAIVMSSHFGTSE